MPYGKGTYGIKVGRPAKRKTLSKGVKKKTARAPKAPKAPMRKMGKKK